LEDFVTRVRGGQQAPAADWLTHPEFRAFCSAIRENPDDNVSRLVAADWLQERGDAAAAGYAEFIRESVRCPKRLSRRAEGLLEENLRQWLGPLFSTGKQARLESFEREGGWVRLRLAYCPHPAWDWRVGTIRLRWTRGVVGRVEFGDRDDYGPQNALLRLGARVATACPAALLAPARETVNSWLSLSFTFRNDRSLTKLWRVAVNYSTADLLPSVGPQGRVVAANIFDRREALNFAQEFMVGPMTEYAHRLAAAEMSGRLLVA
jgi:uncharacterized protein (TIGR02996 family)